MTKLLLFNKPYRVLSQFTDVKGRRTLTDFIDLPGFYPAGRLDYDSEGLLLLCDDGELQQRISNPRYKTWKTYQVQLEGRISEVALQQLRDGVTLKDGPTLPAKARLLVDVPFPPRKPPIRHRPSLQTSWIEIRIREGRNRQIRRMAAAVGFPVLRLVRTRIGDWTLNGIESGAYDTQTVNLPKQSPQSKTRNGRSKTAIKPAKGAR